MSVYPAAVGMRLRRFEGQWVTRVLMRFPPQRNPAAFQGDAGKINVSAKWKKVDLSAQRHTGFPQALWNRGSANG
jgi:hypothetical protein